VALKKTFSGECGFGQFRCPDGECLVKDLIGNGIFDCSDGSDEDPITILSQGSEDSSAVNKLLRLLIAVIGFVLFCLITAIVSNHY
jgi:hypothetical protein